ncbi:hypothetical protein NQ317_000338 [Molorchus minor]|uniref:NADH dehydrogenase [ubiquinone] 1 alpha subcomplex assembly factor 3 n=1 Tax=Molorchus minor TaxID=1323400 RepID=A0ABQ9JZL4_9CUCU|nr:hypothetical protein NQ317_000338 [Molorchus minor]
MSYETVHLDKICRTCLSTENDMRSIFSIDQSVGETMKLFEMLMSCASVQVMENDGLPSHVCLQCVHYITRAYYFKQLCERSENTLRELLGRPPIQTLLELKPMFVNGVLETGTQADIISADPETSVAVIEAINAAVDTNTCPPDENILDSVNISDLEMKDPENDMDLKFVNFGNDPILPNAMDDDTGQEQKTVENIIEESEKNEYDDKKLDVKDFDVKDFKITSLDVKPLDINPPKSKRLLRRKHRDETEQPIFPCEECIMCFTSPIDLKAHVKSDHKFTRHICKVCNQGFASASTLCRHIKVHGGAKRHLCSECGKGFSRSDDLTRHLRTHTGEKPFPCKLCGKSFAQSFRLLEHMRAHANEKSFVCSVCGKAFSRYTSLAAHNKTHTGIKTHTCEVCGKKRHYHRSSTLSSPSAYEGEGKTTVQILNNETELGLMINGISQVGFRLNNDMTVLGPMVIFPRSVLSWNVNSITDICKESLSLFTIIEPKPDIIVMGVGDKIENFNFYQKLIPFSKQFKIPFEILPTEQACSTFNFLNSEGRYVAGAMIPPQEIAVTEDDELQTKMRYQNLYVRE